MASSSSKMRSSQSAKIMYTDQLPMYGRTDTNSHLELYILSSAYRDLRSPYKRRTDSANQDSEGRSSPTTPRVELDLEWMYKKLAIQPPSNDPVGVESKSLESKNLESTTLESKGSLRRRELAYVHNRSYSSFHNLPMEMILQVAGHMSLVTRLVMLRVCSRFRSGLALHKLAPKLGSDTLTVRERYQLKFLMRQEEQDRLQENYDFKCDLAPLNSELYRFGCSGCRLIHGVEDFSSQELSLSPKARVCKGLEGSFQLCGHLSFSGKCLLRTLRKIENAEYICQMDHRSGDIISWDLYSTPLRRGSSVGFHRGQMITFDTVVVILNLDGNQKVTQYLLSYNLRKKCLYICPHLNSSSPEVFGGTRMKPECRKYTHSGYIWLESRSPCLSDVGCRELRSGECVSWSQCPHPHCFTRYCLRRVSVCLGNAIVLEISRDLFGTPTDSAWLAQMEEEKSDTMVAANEEIYIGGSRLGQVNSCIKKIGKIHECTSGLKKCEVECVLARCNAFMSS